MVGARWTAEKDQLFFFLLLEQLDVPTDVLNAISQAWPKDQDDIPTPSALRQRINRAKRNKRSANPFNLNEYPPTITDSAPQAAVTRKRGPKKIKTENASEDDIKPVSGKRKRAIDGLAKMSKRSVYELGETNIKIESENDEKLPDAKRVKTLTFNVEGGGIHEFDDSEIKVESEDDVVITDEKKAKTFKVKVKESGVKFEAPYGRVVHNMKPNVKVEESELGSEMPYGKLGRNMTSNVKLEDAVGY